MQTSLTDQLFKTEEKSLADQLFEQGGQVSLTDQLAGGEVENKKAPTTFPPTVVEPKNTPQQLMKRHSENVEKFFKDSRIESPGMLDRVGKVAAETLQGIAELPRPTNIGVLKGGLDVVLSMPGFMTGLIDFGASATGEIINQLSQGSEVNLEIIYNAGAEGMQRSMEFFDPAKKMLIGEPTPDSQVTSQILMAPITGLSMVGNKIAEWEGFKDYPNIRGAARFIGDISGLIGMGMLIHGPRAKAEFTKGVEEVVKAGEDIIAKEQAIEGIPNEIVKQTQKKVLEMEKKQAELKAEFLSKKLSEDIEIREELARQAEQIAKEKLRPVQDTGLKEPSLTDQLAEKDGLKIKPTEEELPSIDIEKEFGDPALFTNEDRTAIMDSFLDKEFGKVDEVDIKTGTVEVISEGKSSPFYQDLKTTEKFKAMYEERAKSVSEDVELFTQKLINDVNRWEKGEDLPIDQIRDGLSGLASEAEGLRDQFITGQDHAVWKDTVSEAAAWARRLEREDGLNIKPSKPPLDPDAAKLAKMFEESRGVKLVRDTESTKEAEVIELPKIKRRRMSVKDQELRTEFRALKKEVNDIYNKYPWLKRRDAGILGEGEKVDVNKVPMEVFQRLDTINDRLLELAEIDYDRIAEDRPYSIMKKDDLVELLSEEGIEKLKKANLKIVDKGGVKLTSGVDPVEGIKAIIDGAKGVSRYVSKARGLKSFKPGYAIRSLKEEFTRSFIDRSGNIRSSLLDKLGDKGYEVIQKMYLSKGASSLASSKLKQMQKEVYGGLSKGEKAILDTVILSDRIGDIAKYKSESQFKYPKGLEPKNVVAYSELFGEVEGIVPERAAVIRQRAQAYFEWMKKPLLDMLESGLITQEEFVNLSSHNYRKLKLVDIYDKKNVKLDRKGRTVYDSGIEALSKGRDTDVFEPSSEVMALEVFNRAYGRILNNEANKTLLDIARTDKANEFVRVKESKEDRIPSGWHRTFVYEGGERKSMFLSPEMSKEWITSNPEISFKYGQILRYATGSPVLRTFATGINWGFALANLPKDIMHTWFAARIFKDGKWSGVYDPVAPVFGLQIGSDLISTFSDAVLRKGRYDKYIEEGGGMEFLVHQGRIFKRGRQLESRLDKVQNFMGYFGETSEIMTRLAIRERVIKRRAKEKGISIDEARKDKNISTEATFAARDYMDFGQGGGISKALDNGIPYLNATIIGTRGLIRSFKPGSGTALSSTFKLAQFAALTTGLYIAAKNLAPKTMKDLEGNIDTENNMVIPLGDEFSFEDGRGQTRYPYIKIPLDPGQKFFKTFFEASTDKWLGNEVDVDRVVNTLKEQSPVGISSLPPTISGALGYVTNKDFWLNEDIVNQTFSYPNSKEEYNSRTPQAYKDLGRVTGLSPERTRYMVEELVTSGTVWSYLAGKGYDELFSDMPKDKREQHIAEVLSKMPIAKRFIGITNPYSKSAKKINKAQEAVDLERFIENRGLDTLAEGYLFKGNTSRKEVIDYIKGAKDLDTFKRLKERFKFQEVVKDLPERSFWLRLQGVSTEVRAQVFVDRLESADPGQKEQIWKEYGIVSRAGGVVTKEFRKEVSKIMGEKE